MLLQLGLPDIPTAENISAIVQFAEAELWDMLANVKGTMPHVKAIDAATEKGKKSGKKGGDTAKPKPPPTHKDGKELCRNFMGLQRWCKHGRERKRYRPYLTTDEKRC